MKLQKRRWLFLGILIIGLFFLISMLPFAQWIQALMRWVDQLGLWAPLVFGFIYAIATVLMVPAFVLTIAAGSIFGLLIGTIIVSLASTIGAALAFLIARYLARCWVTQQLKRYPKFEALDQAIGKEGWKIVALLRLSPLVPFNLQNYLYGLTAIHFWPYVLTSWIAMLPGTLLYVYLGYIGQLSLAAISQGESQKGPLQWSMLVIGFLATIAVSWYVAQLARQAIQERTKIEEKGHTQPRHR
jgi:uncharacterized membrane protein YdjX (TVP38/TMEM64 family)